MIQFNHGKLLLEPLALKAGERVLDVGTGTGRLAEFAAHLVGPNGHVVGLDPLDGRIAIARLRQSTNLVFETGRAEDLSRLEAGAFDVIYFNSVLHWIADKRPVFEQAHRALPARRPHRRHHPGPGRAARIRVLLRRAVAEAGLDAERLSAHGVHAATDDQLRALFDQA